MQYNKCWVQLIPLEERAKYREIQLQAFFVRTRPKSRNHMLHRWLITLVCLIWLLGACGLEEEMAISPSPVALTSITSTPFAPHTVTPVPSSTPTKQPTTTPSPIPTYTPTPTPTLIPSPTISFWETYQGNGGGELYPLRVVNQIGGRINRVVVADDVAYVAVGPRIWTLNVSQLETPLTLGQTDILPGTVQCMELDRHFLYISVRDSSGYWVVDISWPDTPLILGFVPLEQPTCIWQENGRFYTSMLDENNQRYLLPLDMTDPMKPIIVAKIPVPSSNYLLTDDDRLITAVTDVPAKTTDVQIIDIADPENPQLVRGFSIPATGRIAEVHNSYLYFFGWWEMFIIDLGSLDDADFINATGIEFPFIEQTMIDGDRLYEGGTFCDVDSCGASVSALNIANPQAFTEPTGLHVGHYVEDIFATNDTLYVATGQRLAIIRRSESGELEEIGRWETSGTLNWLGIDGNTLFTLNPMPRRLQALTLVDPVRPHLQGQYDAYLDAATIGDGDLFTTGWFAGLHRLHFDDSNWQETAVYDGRVEDGRELTAGGSYLYALFDGVLTVFDITDPTQLKPIVGDRDGYQSGNDYQLAIDHNTLYVLSADGVRILDVTNPATPIEMSVWPYGNSLYGQYDLAAKDGYFYLLEPLCWRYEECRIAVLRRIDATDPTNPVFVDSLEIPDAVSALTWSGDKLVLLADGLSFVDVSDPEKMVLLGQFPTPGIARGLSTYGDYLYIADGDGGVLILQENW